MSVQTKKWTREEYHRLARAGVLGEDDRVQLIGGEIVQMGPQGAGHAAGVRASEEALRAVFGDGFDVRVQLPLAIAPDSEPEPDVAVVRGSWRDYRQSHPSTAVLVVEVADTSAAFDRERKGSLYAAAGIPEYWVIDLAAGSVDVYRQPGPDPSGRLSYRSHQRFDRSGEIAPLTSPGATIQVHALLP